MSKDLKVVTKTSIIERIAGGQGGSNFETAIEACGIGLFNVLLILASISTAIAVIFTTSSLSFIMPMAGCNLELSLMDKGYLNAMSFAGMIFSAVPWGYIADTMGRRIVLVYALILDGLFVMISGMSQNFIQLLILKFIDGFLICGPFAVVMSYVSEFHGQGYRPSVMMILGMNFSAAAIILPILAVGILPHHIYYEISNLHIYTWHVFLMVTAIVPLVGGIINIFIPESPKFLMTQGRNDEALECFRKIFAVNTGKPKSEYPITSLAVEDPELVQQRLKFSNLDYKATHNVAREKFIEGLKQIRPLFSKPYFLRSIHVYTMFFCILLGLNSIRLWLPQIFVTLDAIQKKEIENENSDLCSVLEQTYQDSKSEDDNPSCHVGHISIGSYSDNIIVALASFCFYIMATVVIRYLGNNFVLKLSLCVAFFSGILLYFSDSRLMILATASIYISFVCIAATTVVTAAVNLFPTQMRTMVIILMMTFGRFGSFLGNILFPYFLSIGCVPPFLLIGSIMTASFLLSLLLPNTSNIELK